MSCRFVVGVGLLVLASACGPSTESEVAEAAPEMARETAPESVTEEAEEQPQFPPEGAMSLSALVAMLEAADHGSIAEIEFEDGAWEVEAVKDGQPGEFRVDAATGAPIEVGDTEMDEGDDAGEEAEETVQLPPDGAKPLSEIIAMLEAAGHGPFAGIEFEGGSWAVAAMKDGYPTELSIDPMTGDSVMR